VSAKQEIEALRADGHLEPALPDASRFFPIFLCLEDSRERAERFGIRSVGIRGRAKRLDREVEIARAARALAEAVEGRTAIASDHLRAVAIEELLVHAA